MKALSRAAAHFAEFVEGCTDSLLGTAYLLTRDRQAAEELVQDTLVALYPRWSKVAQAQSPIAYANPTPAGILGGYSSDGFAPRVVLYTRSGTAVIEWTVTPHAGSQCYSNVTVLSTAPGTTATKSFGRQHRVCGLQVHPVAPR